jgi:hypothetical protein
MALRLDRQIEEIEKIVDRHLDPCKATWNGMPCTLPTNHEPVEPHQFSREGSTEPELAEGASNYAD